MAEELMAPRRCRGLLLALLLFPTAAFAHRLDEYLQATLVNIEPTGVRLQINLTPGVAIADPVLALIDRNHDGIISPEEAAGYMELLKRDLTLRLDGHELALKAVASDFPKPAELQGGSGIIQIEFATSWGVLTAGKHELALEDRHLPALSVYLMNAALPQSEAVVIARQERNENQSRGEIDFRYHPEMRPASGLAGIGILGLLISLWYVGYRVASNCLKRVASGIQDAPKKTRSVSQ
ncbi:MAG: hypothetical protein QM796_12445 [Chthoniobacteraceae bacterium]